MTQLTYTIYAITGEQPGDLIVLVHVAEEPGDYETFRAELFRLQKGTLIRLHRIPEWVTSLFRAAGGNLFAASMKGTMHVMRGGTWSVQLIPGNPSPNHVWGFDTSAIYGCGLDAAAFRLNRNHWERFDKGLKGDLRRIRGTAPDDLWVVGDEGAIFHYDGATWSKVKSPTNLGLLDVLCLSKHEGYICGHRGGCFHRMGKQWTQMQNIGVRLFGLAYYRGQVYVAAGRDGLYSIHDPNLDKVNPTVPANGIVAIGNSLLAWGETTLSHFDGTNWTTSDLDFANAPDA